ncbi:1-(5-phosphoribosyl)-5-[(5-phosphoribosylamino)methylideneamino] imidazole-4-carboxamide isomerase [Litorimonas taeanensis]|uniref:1-(5-phosphoribosyl)-5-[(5-phosphoribosylamino)methylideneamino] imidazole-4-carboxamide isomerase n=1 Tax=Litorimonas taeanensis TaxID=568099 RepID=A0A420WK44_9PROT|nr:1-(5-phosphoribosyl)-5-[(5-phosphoribosylamino)methylideneamino]imidazole-4-carboxamide isomerase [Litorimonas taeanensis]RKQ71387.1 1-(5-phosphoribosyl)-5-[(5-phosphoribosylamino)methylideneamino] imidazole-4-carboxamide isomerase [Litorimonas taeanensis]
MIIPAIDLIEGRCVRLYKGDFNQRTDYNEAPLDVAKRFAEEGATRMHVVDLDGAKHANSEQMELIIELAQESGLSVQTGGGLRDISQIKKLLDGGVERVVIGSLSVTNPQMVKFWLNEFGPEKVIIALDVNIDDNGTPIPATRGWVDAGTKSLWHVLDDYNGSGLHTVLITDIGRDGVLGGANVELYKEVRAQYPSLNLITSGGVGSLNDVKKLKALQPHGIIIGKALYENRFTVTEAVAC